MLRNIRDIKLLIGLVVATSVLEAQFVESFDGPANAAGSIPTGWSYFTGDGNAKMQFIQNEGCASIYVDATNDERNIWWAVVRTRVTGIDMDELIKPGNELRVEARIRVSHAPRRVNLHFNHQRTTDYHSNLMEYDIPDTENWHTISMTTRDFDVRKDDQINAQMALMDWGNETYRVDIDYFKVDVVPSSAVESDLGNPMPYHPTIPDPDGFDQKIPVAQDAMVDFQYPTLNFNDWQIAEPGGAIPIQSVSSSQIVILRWDLSQFSGRKSSGPGLLELSTFMLQRSPSYQKDFGMVRVKEILGGDREWNQVFVTLDSFLKGASIEKVINSQMVIDYPVNPAPFGKSYFVINQQVMNRLLNGSTKGLAICPLGAVNAAFFSSEAADVNLHPNLLLNLK